jgi:hypothetical protein
VIKRVDLTGQTVQVILLSQGGEVIHESEVFPFGDGNNDVKDTELRQAAVEWSPRGEHLLIVDPDGLLGAYQIGNKTLKVFSGVQGGNPLFSYVFDRLVAGDGSGFLAQRGVPGSLSWQGPVLLLPSGVGGIFHIDCARRTVGFEWDAKTAVEFERIQRENILMTTQLAGGALVVQARSMGAKGPGGKLLRIEVWFLADGRRRTLVEEFENPEIFPWISPSPDGTMAAIRYGLKDETKSRILVVDDKGTVLANFEVE